ncbi:uncharacterized protein LOC134186434 [Corticium candelabrum]|uniref:uncharacterized protein LOC134186434 n=1 Tax=Corticium candelabrum TaxID=121492 RepID=UPI002E275093|nr:uncharacterized protein LOC134186434 [Corticium candelabrum]
MASKFKPPDRHGDLLQSEAIERWGLMRERTFDTFRVTPKTAFYGFVFGLLVPAGIYSLLTWHKKRQDRLDGKPERKYFF